MAFLYGIYAKYQSTTVSLLYSFSTCSRCVGDTILRLWSSRDTFRGNITRVLLSVYLKPRPRLSVLQQQCHVLTQSTENIAVCLLPAINPTSCCFGIQLTMYRNGTLE